MRTACKSARTSGRSIAGLRMSPSSPPVQHTSTLRMPSARVLRARARTLRRFVVGVGVDLEQAQLRDRVATGHRFAATAEDRRYPLDRFGEMRPRAGWAAIALVALLDVLLFAATFERRVRRPHPPRCHRQRCAHERHIAENTAYGAPRLARIMEERRDHGQGRARRTARGGRRPPRRPRRRRDARRRPPRRALGQPVRRRLRRGAAATAQRQRFPCGSTSRIGQVAAAAARSGSRNRSWACANAGITIHGTDVAVTAGHGGKGIDTARAHVLLHAAARVAHGAGHRAPTHRPRSRRELRRGRGRRAACPPRARGHLHGAQRRPHVHDQRRPGRAQHSAPEWSRAA